MPEVCENHRDRHGTKRTTFKLPGSAQSYATLYVRHEYRCADCWIEHAKAIGLKDAELCESCSKRLNKKPTEDQNE